MHNLMPVHGPTLWKPFSTYFTNIWLHSCMFTHMYGHMGIWYEISSTNRAWLVVMSWPWGRSWIVDTLICSIVGAFVNLRTWSVKNIMINMKCSDILNTFVFLFSNKMWAIMAAIHEMLVRIANREDTDQTASSEAVWSGSALFV